MNENLFLGLSTVSVVLLVLANLQLRKLMITQAQAVQKLTDVNTQLQKISVESSKNLALVQELKDIIANGPPVSQELEDAINAVATQTQAVDDLTPDITDGSGSTGEVPEGTQRGVGPNGDTGRKGPTTQL